MLSRISHGWPAVFLAASLVAAPVFAAEGEGREDLDKATEAKVAASSSGSINDLSEAIRLAESAMKKGLDATGTEFAKRLLGSAYLQRGQEIIKQLSRSASSVDDARRQCQLAVSDLEKALTFEPKQPQAHLWLAKLTQLSESAKAKDMIAHLDKAIELGNDDPATKAEALVVRADLQEEPEKRLADLDAAVQLIPDNAAVVRIRGMALADMNKLELALADLTKALVLDPTNEPSYEAKAIVLARLKRFDEAIAVLDKAREINPKSLGPLVQRAKVHAQQEKFDAALEDMNQAMAIDSGNVALLILRAGVYQEKGDKAKAMADMDAALKLKPDLPMLVRTRAMFLAQNDRLDEAIGDLEKLILKNPKDSATLLQLAMYQSAKKNSPKAIETYRTLLKLAPDSWQAMRGLADVLLNVGKQAEALELYEKAFKLEPKDDGVLNNLAWLLCTSPDEKIRNGKRAVELATEACKVTEYRIPHILSTLAAAYAEIGDFDNAVKWISKGLEIAEKAKETDKDGSKETKDALTKELENYKAKKPTRELLSEESGKGEMQKPDEKK